MTQKGSRYPNIFKPATELPTIKAGKHVQQFEQDEKHAKTLADEAEAKVKEQQQEKKAEKNKFLMKINMFLKNYELFEVFGKEFESNIRDFFELLRGDQLSNCKNCADKLQIVYLQINALLIKSNELLKLCPRYDVEDEQIIKLIKANKKLVENCSKYSKDISNLMAILDKYNTTEVGRAYIILNQTLTGLENASLAINQETSPESSPASSTTSSPETSPDVSPSSPRSK